jgi:hypothetical protein
VKKALLITLVLCIVAIPLWSQDENQAPEELDKEPSGSFSFILTNSFAPIGFGLEFFVEQFGIGPTFTAFFFAIGGEQYLLFEPGGYVRFYFKDISSSFYLTAGINFLLASSNVEMSGGLLKINLGIGYNAIVGKRGRSRVSFEVGPRIRQYTDPDVADDFPILIHFMLLFGSIF